MATPRSSSLVRRGEPKPHLPDLVHFGYRSSVPKRNLIARVLEGLPASSDSVTYPDHPLLLGGPDILASVNNRLTAYFVLDQPTKRLPIGLLSSVLLSRLALPREISFVLVLGAETQVRPSDLEIFEEVVQESHENFSGIPIGRMRESRNEYIEPLRRPHNERFSRAWASTARRREIAHERFASPTSARSLQLTRRPRSRYVDFSDGRFFLAPPGPDSRISTRRLFDQATNAAVQADYWLDLGVPGIQEVEQVMRSNGAYLALHENLIPFPEEVHRFDVLKPFRAAAFAGFAVRQGLPNVT